MAYDDSNFLFKEGSLIITSIIESKEYTKIKIENKEDNKIEFVESYLQKDGTYKYIVTTEDNTFTIFKKDENIMLEDKNGNIIEIISLEIASLETFDLYNNASPTMKAPCIPDSDWKVVRLGYTSRSLVYSDYAMLIGVIASIFGTPAAGVAVIVATWLYNRNMKDAYYYFEEQHRFRDGMLQKRTYTQFYTNSDYTTKLGSGEYSKIYDLYRVGQGCK